MTLSTLPARKWVTHQLGDVNNLNLQDVDIAPPLPDQVRIRVKSIGLNFADVSAVLGISPSFKPIPFTPGFEVCGVVESTGANVTQFKPGDRVFVLTLYNCYVTAMTIDSKFVFKLRDGWTFAQGAAWPMQALTAWYALYVLGGITKTECRFQTSENKRVLVHSAAGGVGTKLIQLIRHVEGEVIATVGNPGKVDVLKECGVQPEYIIVRGRDDKQGFAKEVKKRLGGDEEGVDVVIDSVMGEYFQEGWKVLNPGGRYIVMGYASATPTGALGLKHIGSWVMAGWRMLTRPKLDLLEAAVENKTVSPFDILAFFGHTELTNKGFAAWKEVEGLEPPMVGRVFRFEEAKEALEFFQSGRSVGKIVLTVEE